MWWRKIQWNFYRYGIHSILGQVFLFSVCVVCLAAYFYRWIFCMFESISMRWFNKSLYMRAHAPFRHALNKFNMSMRKRSLPDHNNLSSDQWRRRRDKKNIESTATNRLNSQLEFSARLRIPILSLYIIIFIHLASLCGISFFYWSEGRYRQS